MQVSSTNQAAAQLAQFKKHNPAAATATKLGSLTSAGAVSQLSKLSGSLEILQQSVAAGPLGGNLDVKA